ncbi:MAG: DUF2442 domain-containing protein [Planctomycetes bacterium]|nr:DUF2442 domain-containing protein [Planctomycetota bacterium]
MNHSLVDVVEVRPLGGHRLWLRFDDRVEGELDLATILRFEGVFAPLAAPEFFEKVRIDPDWGTLVWPGEVYLDSEMLHSLVRGEPLPRD